MNRLQILCLYFRSKAPSIRNKVSRCDDCASTFQGACDIEIFKCPGRCMSPRGIRQLSNKDYKVAFMYILTNIPEMDDFLTNVLQISHTHFNYLSILTYRHNRDFVHVDNLIMSNGRAA